MRPTRATYALALVVTTCIALGITFGRIEFYILAGVCVTAFVLASLYVLLAPLNLAVRRETSPTILRVGSDARVDLALHNQGSVRTPVLEAVDRLERFQGASVHVAPIRSGDSALIKYEVPTDRRGEISFGPFDLLIRDPFGLVQIKVRAAEAATAMVRPELVNLAAIPTAGGNLLGEFSARKLSQSGNEFVRLRPYVVGDELRRVHWRASARTGDLVVRQNEETRTGVLSIMFDLTAKRYSEAGFERAVSATLSAVTSGFASEDQVNFKTSASPLTRINSEAELNAVDLQLSLIEPSEKGSILEALGQVSRRARSGGTLILIAGSCDDELEAIVSSAKRSFGQVLVILCEKPSQEPSFWHIRHDGTTDLSLGWDAALRGANS